MTDAYLLLRDDEPPLLASRAGGEWRVISAPSRADLRRGSIAVLLPSNATLFLSTPINARSEREALQIARFAIEDDIAESIDDVHLALGSRNGAEQARRVAVISDQRFQSYLASIDSLGLTEAPIYSADDLLPPGDMLVETDEFIRGRLNGQIFSIERDVGIQMVRGLVKEPDDIRVFGDALAETLATKAEGPALQDEASYLAKLADWGVVDDAINLRQGIYAPKRELDLSGLGQWRNAGLLAAALAIVGVIHVAATGYALDARAAQYQDEARELAREGWPQFNGNVGATLSAVRTRGPITAGERMNVLDASAALYAALETVPTAGMRSLRFDQNRNSLSAVLILGSFGDGDALVSAMRTYGFNVEIGEARMLSGELVAELVVAGMAS